VTRSVPASSTGWPQRTPLFPSRIRKLIHLSTRQYARIVDSWVEQLGLDRADYGTHTARRTKATLIYRRTKNLRAVQLLLGGTPSWKARSAILGSRSTTLSKWRSRRRCSATGRSANGTLTGQKRPTAPMG